MDKSYKDNLKLKDFYEQNINKMNVPEEFKGLLLDILMRRAYEFSLSPAECRQDIYSLLNNLTSIKVEKMPDGYENAAGVYCGNEKEIRIAPNFLKKAIKEKDFEVIYEVLTHEVYHALSKDPQGRDRLVSQNKFTKYANTTLLEAIVEKAADRCVYSRGENDKFLPYFHQNKFGYPDITFITDALEASYGVTEQQFLKKAIMGRSHLIDAMASVANENYADTSEFFDGIELNFSRLHGVLYGEKRNYPIDKKPEIEQSIGSMYRLCEWKLQKRMENFQINSIEHAEFFSQYAKYSHNKLFFVMQNATEDFEMRYGKGIKENIHESTRGARYNSLSRISSVSQILENKEKFQDEQETLRMINLAKNGQLTNQDKEYLKMLGIELTVQETFSLEEDFLKRRILSDFENTVWDNQEVAGNIQQVFANSRKSFSWLDNLKNRISSAFKKLTGKEQLALGDGNNNVNSYQSENSNAFAALSEEELKRFNEGVQELLNKRAENSPVRELTSEDRDLE